MPKGAITEYIDVAQIVLYAFWIFFAGLIYYLRREDKREGYPLVYDGPQNRPYLNFPPIPEPKTYLLADGTTVMAPRAGHEPAEINAVPSALWQGAPLIPLGDPMLDAVGPGAYAMRQNVPDRTFEGHLKIVPLRAAPGLTLEERDPDPRGMTVVGADGVAAGTVSDVWVDRGGSHRPLPRGRSRRNAAKAGPAAHQFLRHRRTARTGACRCDPRVSVRRRTGLGKTG